MRAILTYHSIDPSGSAISVDPETFRRHVAWLASGAVRVVPLERIGAVPAGESAVGGTNRWEGRSAPGIPDLPLLDWDGLARVAAQGDIALGAHTRTHPMLTALFGARLDDEIAGSRAALAAHTGRAPTTFAYPYGACNDRVLAATRRSFTIACTTELRVLSPSDDPLRLPRLDAYYFRAPGALERWGSARQRCAIAAREVGRRLRRRFSTRIA